MKKYHSDNRIWYIILILSIPWLILMVWPPITSRNILGSAVMLFLVIFVGLLVTKFTYALLIEKTLKYRELLFFYREIDTSKISAISYAPTWRLQTSFRSVFIFYEVDGSKRRVELKNSFFKESILAEIVYDLKKLNPAIYLEEHAETLVKVHKKKDI